MTFPDLFEKTDQSLKLMSVFLASHINHFLKHLNNVSIYKKNTNKQFNFLFLFLHFQINSRAKMYSDTASTQSYWLINQYLARI